MEYVALTIMISLALGFCFLLAQAVYLVWESWR